MTENRTILIIDDCPEDRKLIAATCYRIPIHLYDFGGRVWGKWAGIVQFGKARCHLLDFLLQILMGWSFWLKKNQIGRTSLPVIMLTVREEAIAVQAMKSGQDYLVKGNDPQILRLAIHNVVERAHLLAVRTGEERFRTSVENLLDCFGIYTSVRDQSGRIIDFSIEYVAPRLATTSMTQSEQIEAAAKLLPSNYEAGLFEEYCQVKRANPFLKTLVYADSYHKQYLTQALYPRL